MPDTEIELAPKETPDLMLYPSPRDQYVESPQPMRIGEIAELWDGCENWTKQNIVRAYKEQDWRWARHQFQARVQAEREAIGYNVDGKFQDRIRDYTIASNIRDIEEIDLILESNEESVITRGGIPTTVPLRPESRSKLLATKTKLLDQLAKRVGIETFKIELDLNEQDKWLMKKNAELSEIDPRFAALMVKAGEMKALPPNAATALPSQSSTVEPQEVEVTASPSASPDCTTLILNP